MKKKTALTTQPNWCAIVLCLFMNYILLDSSYREYGDFSSILKDVRILMMLALVIVSIIAGQHYTFCERHLIIRLYGVPVKKYKWSEVNSIIYMHTWRDKERFSDAHNYGVMSGDAFMISLNTCPPFHPEYYSRVSFSIKHPFSSIFFIVPPWKKDIYIAFFKIRYPQIRIQQADMS